MSKTKCYREYWSTYCSVCHNIVRYITLINSFMPLKLIILQEPIIKLLYKITGTFLLSVCYFKLLIVSKIFFLWLYYKSFKVLIFTKLGLFVTFGDLNNFFANLRYNLHYLSIIYRFMLFKKILLYDFFGFK